MVDPVVREGESQFEIEKGA
jgi:hypothetical protein